VKNLEVARLLYKIADVLEMQEVKFKPRAYRRAARVIENMSRDIEEVWKQGALEDIPGIGKGIAKKISEYLETGKLKYYDKIKKKVPFDFENILPVPEMGPKTAILLYKKLKIKTLKDLEKAARQHKICKLEGMGEKSEQNILQGIQMLKKSKERMLLGHALPIAREIEKRLEACKEVRNVSTAGSLRRKKETIGDIDILVSSKKPKAVMDFFTAMPDIRRVLAKGETKSSVILDSGLQVDLRIVKVDEFGSALQYFTGSKDHNIKLREYAIKRGYKLNEYGLFDKKTGKRAAGRTEKEIYHALNMSYIEPEMRENRGEIRLAIAKKLPKIIHYGDVKGDLHVHSKYSDGADTIKEIAKAAMNLGYQYVAITDHLGLRIAGGLTERQMNRQLREVEKLNKTMNGFTILSGAEVEVKPDGSLNAGASLLRKLDVVVAGIHSRFKSSKKEMTRRILNALQNEHVDILAHPTGRMINKRDAYDVDLDEVFEMAKKTKTLLEINASPDRLDLNDTNCMAAKLKQVKMVISTDAHNIDQLWHMELGEAMARRGWLEKKDVVNTLPLKRFLKHLK
jgi:DNA polymerase (family 10)